MKFEFKIEAKENYNLVHFSGSLIEGTQSKELLEAIENQIQQSGNNFIVNLGGIKHMNSNGLNVLINILTKSRNAGGETIIANVPEKVTQLIVITKLNTVFTVTGTVEEAIPLINKVAQCL